MGRPSLIIGGVTGIGAATAKLLKAEGRNVVAIFFGNMKGANKFYGETGIALREWDVADFDATQKAVKEVAVGNVSSINALTGRFGQTSYSAEKVGIIGLTKALASEGAGCGITVNAIAPGYTDTGMARTVPPKILEAIVATA